LTIGALLVQTVYQSSQVYKECTNSVPIVKNSQKTVKTAKITIGVPIVTCLHRVRLIHKVRVRVPVRRIHKTPTGSRTWAFQRTHHGTPKIQDGGDPPPWILTPKCKKMRFSQKLSSLKLWCLLTTYSKLCKLNWAFQRTHYWIPTIEDG